MKNFLLLFSTLLPFQLLGFQDDSDNYYYNEQRLWLNSTPIYSTILSDKTYEFSFPDLTTLSHVRFSFGEKENYQFLIGVGFVALDLGFSKQLLVNEDYAVRLQTLLGNNKMYSGFWILEQKLCFGNTANFKIANEYTYNLAVGYGVEFVNFSKMISAPNSKYLTMEIGGDYRYYQIQFSIRTGIQSVWIGEHSARFMKNLGFSTMYWF